LDSGQLQRCQLTVTGKCEEKNFQYKIFNSIY